MYLSILIVFYPYSSLCAAVECRWESFRSKMISSAVGEEIEKSEKSDEEENWKRSPFLKSPSILLGRRTLYSTYKLPNLSSFCIGMPSFGTVSIYPG